MIKSEARAQKPRHRPAPKPPKVDVQSHPPGLPHTKSTIVTMAKLATAGSHSYQIRSLATKIVHAVPSKQVLGELQTIYRWVRDHVRYRFDPVGLEWVQSPARTLKEKAGDCDDMATLIAALVGSLGHRWRFITVGPSPNIQKHVAAQAWAGKGWVSLDPVLEPPSNSTAPSTAVGMFGRTAPARSQRIWSSEGTMLSGCSGPVSSNGVALWEGKLGSNTRLVHVEPRARVAGMLRRRNARGLQGLGGDVAPELRELWSWYSYYPSNPSMRDGAGVLPTPNAAYGSPGRPGAERIVISAPPGSLSGGLGYIDGLGFGFLKKIGKAIGGAVKGAAKLVTKIPGVSAVAGLIPGGAMGLNLIKGVAKIGGKAGIKGAAAGALSSLAKCLPEPPSMADFLDLKADLRFNAGLCKHADLVALEAMIKAKCMSPEEAKKLAYDAVVAEQAKSKVRNEITIREHAKAMAALRAGQKKALAKLIAKNKAKKCACDKKDKAKAKAQAKASAKASAKATASLPAGSTQVFDAKLNRYVVYAPAPKKKKKTISGRGALRGVSGLGLIKPTLTLSLGNVLGSFGLATAAQASTAVSEVTAFIKKNGQPPQVRLPGVLAFQKADGALSSDGVWGNNARSAAAWYLGKQVASMPTVAKPYAAGKVTWKPPAQKPPAIVAKPKAKAIAKPKAKAIAKPKAPAVLPIRVVATPIAPVIAREPPPAPYVPEPEPPPAPRAYALPSTEPAMEPARAPDPVPIAIAPPGMVVASISKTDPGLPDIRTGKRSKGRRKPGQLLKQSPGSPTIDVYGPTVVDDKNPLVWLAIGWALLHHHRRSHAA